MSTSSDTKKKPVLGIAGFFGHGNYGDELFLEVFEEYFGGTFDLRIIPDLPVKPYFSRPVEEVVSQVDAILIGGGDLIRPWGMDERYWHTGYLAKPVFVLGIGVVIREDKENEKPHITKRYRKFLTHPNVKFIGTRDPESAAWINKYVEPEVPAIEAPDVVCGLTLPPVETADPPCLGIVTRLRPNREEPDDYSRLDELATYASGRGWRVRQLILGTGAVGFRDLENAKDLEFEGKEIVYSADLDDLSRAIGECKAIVSMKFHGTVVATMYGVPSIVLIPTSKNRNFMRRVGRTDLLSRFDAPDLLEKFGENGPEPIDAAAVAELRERAATVLREVAAKAAEVVGAPVPAGS